MASGAIKGITVEIDGNTTKLQTALRGVNSTLSTSQKALKEIDKLLKMDPGNTDLIKQKQQYLAESIDATRQKLETEKQALQQLDTAGGGKAVEQQRALEREVAATEQKLKALEKEAAQCASVLGTKMQAAGQKMQALGQSVSQVGQKLTTHLTVPLTAAAAAALKVTADFDSAMSQVRAISGATGEQFDALREKARALASESKFSATEVAEGFSYMAMAGWDTQAMLDGIGGVLQLAAASGEDLATTSDIVTDALTAFGLSASDSAHFADVLAAASSNANTNVSMMGETFKYVAPVAGAMGYDVEDVAVAIGLMANSGIKASQAGTALRNILTKLAKPTKESSTAMEALDISLTDAEGNMKPFMEVIEDLRDRFSGLSEAEAAQYAAMLAGQNGMSGLLAIVNAAPADFETLTAAIDNCDGATADMAATMQDNLTGRLTELKSKAEELGISFGDLLVPKAEAVVEAASNLITWISGLDEGTKNLVINVGLAAAAAGPLLSAFGSLAQGAGAVATAMGKMANAIAGGGAAGVVYAFGLAAAAVGIYYAAVTGIAEAQNKANAEAERTSTSFHGIARRIQEAGDAYSSAISAIDAEQANVTGLVGSLESLIAANDGTAASQQKIQSAVKALNDAVPNLGLEYDGLTNSVNLTRDAILRLAQAQANQARIEAAQAELVPLMEERATAEQELADAQAELADAQAVYDQAVQDYNAHLGEAPGIVTNYADAMNNAAADVDWAAGRVDYCQYVFDELDGKTNALTDEILELSGGLDEGSGALEGTGDAAEGAGDALEELSEEELAAQEAAEKAAEAYQQLCDDLSGMPEIVSLTGMSVTELADMLTGAGMSAEQFRSGVESVRDGIVNGFEEMAEGSKISADDMIANLQGNLARQQEWSGNMRTLWAQSFGDEGMGGTVRGFLSYLAQQGPEYAGVVAEFANGGYDKLVEAASQWNAAGQQAGQDYADGVAMGNYVAQESGAELAGGAAEGMEGASGDMQASGESAANAAVEGFDSVDGKPSGEEIAGEFGAGLDGKNGDLKTAGENAAKAALEGFDDVDGAPSGEALAGEFATGIGNKAGEVGDAAEAAANDAKEQAKVDTSPVGEYFSSGLAAGIRAGRSGVIRAAIEVMKEAVQAAKEAGRIESPSKVMRDEVGKFLTEGIAVGMLDAGALQSLESSADALVSALANWFRVDMESAESEVTSAVSDWAKALQDGLSETIRQGEHAIKMIGWHGGDSDAMIAEYKKLQDGIHRQAEVYRKLGLSENSKYIQDLQAQWWGYEEKIRDIEEEKEKARLEAEREAQEERLKAAEEFADKWAEALDEFADSYQSAFNDIMKAQENMQNKLSSYGELFHLTGTTVSLTNLDSYTKFIERYGGVLDKLQGRGIQGGLMQEILGMDVKEATLYGEKLLSMSNREWEKYMDSYAAKEEAAARISENFFKQDLENLNSEYLDKLPEQLDGLTEGMAELGSDAAELFAQAFAEKISDWAPLMQEALGAAVGSLTGDASAMVNFGTASAGSEDASREIVQAVASEQAALTGLLQSIADNTATVGTLVINLDGSALARAELPYIIAAASANGTPIVNV